MNRYLHLPTLITILTSLLLSSQSFASNKALGLIKATDLLEKWNPDQHLYVKGQLGIASANLDALEVWLDQNAPNWTILLCQSAQQESYTDARGHAYYGMDAVEHGLGKGLPAQTAFSQLTHPETGQSNGAFYILFLNERKFSYFASDTYANRGLGTNNWIGQLDAPAKKAMRNGGRMTDSVKDTIRHIDAKLAKALSLEKRRQQEAALHQRHNRQLVDQQIITTEEKLALLTTKLATFKEHPQWHSGDLAKTDLTQLRTSLLNARESWKDGHIDAAQNLVKNSQQKTSFLLDELAQFQVDRPNLLTLEKELKSLTLHSWNLGGEEDLTDARRQIQRSLQEHQKGNRNYREHYVIASEIKQSIVENNQKSETALIADQKKRKQDQKTQQLAIYTGVGSSALLLTVFGIRANRRRKPHKTKATDLLKSRQAEMSSVNDRFIQLIDRSNLIVGTRDDLTERGYTGLTLDQSKKALQLTDRAIILSDNVSDIISQSQQLTHPRNPFSQIRNTFSSTRYLKATDLLDTQFSFSEEGTEEGNKPSVENLPLEIQLPHWKNEMENTITKAESTLNKIENAWSTFIPRCETIEKRLASLEEQESAHRELCQTHHGHLLAESLFNEWISHIRETLEVGLSLGKGDPLSALAPADEDGSLAGPVVRADEMTQEARSLLKIINDFHQKKSPDLITATKELEQLNLSTTWIDRALEELTDQQDNFISIAQAESILDDLASHQKKLNALHTQTLQAHDLGLKAHQETAKALDLSEEKVQSSRQKLKETVVLEPPHDRYLLAESPEFDPSRHLREARRHQEASLANLNRGDTSSAEKALTHADQLITTANTLITDTLDAAENYPATRQSLLDSRESLLREIETTNDHVENFRQLYTPKALQLKIQEGSPKEANESAASSDDDGFMIISEPPASSRQSSSDLNSLADTPQYLEQASTKIQRHLDQAEKHHLIGQLLKAAKHLDDGQALNSHALELTEFVTTQKKEFEKTTSENAELYVKARRHSEDLDTTATNPRTTQETLIHIATTAARLEEIHGLLPANSSRPTHPLENHENLEDLISQLKTVQELQEQDLHLYDTLTQNLPLAQGTLKKAHKLYTRAKTDRIPDSSKTTEALQQIETLDTRLVKLSGDINLEQNPHGNWPELHSELLEIHASLSQALITLREELKLANDALQQIHSATRQVNTTTAWRGSHGTRCLSPTGRSALNSANQSIEQGDYRGALRSAGLSHTYARQSMANARSREAALVAAERRRRRNAQRRHFSSPSSFGSSSGGFSSSRSFGGGSSISRSSFSSGSGVSRSGW